MKPSRRAQFVLPVRTAGRFLVIACGALNIALPDNFVRGILRPEEADTTASNVAAIYHLIDLGDRLQQGPSRETPESRIILCGKDEPYAFKVDQVYGYVDLEAREIRRLPAHLVGEQPHCLTGLFLVGEGMACLVDLDWLLDRHVGSRESSLPLESDRTGTEVLELEVARDGDDAPWAQP